MGNTENLKSAVSSISDEELRARVESVMGALGIPQNAIGQKFTDVSALRGAIMNMSESDLRKVMSAIGNDRAQAILRELGKK